MPTYDYVCQECKKKFAVDHTVDEHERKRPSCPKCKSRKVERVWGGVQVHTAKKS
jgi:putative FmdB family regulatory protein